MIRSAYTPGMVRKVIDSVWNKFDTDGNGVLDIKEAKKFVDTVLRNLCPDGRYDIQEFNSWFSQIDKDQSGSLDKEEFCKFITRVARTEMYGIKEKDLSVFREQLQEGSHHIQKLVQQYKLNGLDYLQVCDLTRKVFRCFDLSGNAQLGKIEMKCLLEHFTSEMNTIGTTMSKQTFQKWFESIDTDGNQNITLTELIQAFCGIFKIEQPNLVKSSKLPSALIEKNQNLRLKLKKSEQQRSSS